MIKFLYLELVLEKLIFWRGFDMNELQVIDNKQIQSMIHEIRGVQVILDKDLAFLYDTETRKINQAVKRNKERFPEEFCFQLNENEYISLKSQIVISNLSRNWGGVRYLPYAFTEQGVAMLSALLKTEKAVKQSIAVMNAFVAMRRFLSSNLLDQNFYKNKILEHDERIKLLEDFFSSKTFSNEIFYEGQIFDAYAFLLDIFDSSKESIIIIDNYVSKELFKLLSKTKKNVTIYSKNITNDLIDKYKKQYDNVNIKFNDSYHDRFIIIDNKILYHCGSSFKDLGKNCFCISKIDNKGAVDDMLNRL